MTTPGPAGRLAAVWFAPEDLRIEERPVQDMGPDDVRVSVRSVGVCGSDVHFFYRGHETNPYTEPFVMGHEAMGVVTETGSRVGGVTVGDRVAIEPGVPCGVCAECRIGTYNLCARVVFMADPPVDGAFATEIVTNGNFVYPVPDGISDDAAALLEPVSCAIAACRRAG